MLRLRTMQPDFWDSLLPPEARRISPELEAVDALLDDAVFLAPFQRRFPAQRGRYTIPMETYLRLMYLKRRYQLGYESLVAEVTDSVSWRRFCRISLSGQVPDPSTLIKLTNGPCQGVADEVHTALVQQLARKRVLRGRKARVDTTVVEADIHYPTDAGLLADGVRVVTRTIRQLQRAGLAAGERLRNVGRSVKQRLLYLGKALKQPKEQQRTTRASVTTEVLGLTRRMVRRVFLLEIALIAALGLAIGMALGILLAYNVYRHYFAEVAVFTIPYLQLAAVGAIAIGCTFLATVSPAWRASKLPPAETLRYIE